MAIIPIKRIRDKSGHILTKIKVGNEFKDLKGKKQGANFYEIGLKYRIVFDTRSDGLAHRLFGFYASTYDNVIYERLSSGQTTGDVKVYKDNDLVYFDEVEDPDDLIFINTAISRAGNYASPQENLMPYPINLRESIWNKNSKIIYFSNTHVGYPHSLTVRYLTKEGKNYYYYVTALTLNSNTGLYSGYENAKFIDSHSPGNVMLEGSFTDTRGSSYPGAVQLDFLDNYDVDVTLYKFEIREIR